MTGAWSWITLALLGAYHGLNPGMGWLFAVALGLQEQNRRAVLRALGPIALGHALAVALVVVPIVGLQLMVAPRPMHLALGGLLVAFGLYKLLAPMSHPRWVGMRVSSRQLVLWSFLMATAHGAGLMLAPLLLRSPPHAPQQAAGSSAASPMPAMPGMDHAAQASGAMPGMDHAAHLRMVAGGHTPSVGLALLAIVVHTLAMFAVMAVVGLVVFERVGLKVLRTAWFNLDLIWAGALILAGILTVVL